MRDRVPALLGPGEFVMKRSAARGIGGPVLNRMNATGSARGNIDAQYAISTLKKQQHLSQCLTVRSSLLILLLRDLRNN